MFAYLLCECLWSFCAFKVNCVIQLVLLVLDQRGSERITYDDPLTLIVSSVHVKYIHTVHVDLNLSTYVCAYIHTHICVRTFKHTYTYVCRRLLST